MRVTIGDARRLDQLACQRREAGEAEFVDVGRDFSRGDVHFFGELLGNNVHHEFLCGEDIRQGVLRGQWARAMTGDEAHDGWVCGTGHEKTERREISDAAGI